MKNFTIITFLLISFVNYSQVGIGTATPANTLDVNGWIKVGNQAVVPAPASVAGSIRYNSTKNCMEFYDGTTWACIGQPKMQTTVVVDGINESSSGSTGSNLINWTTGGYGTVKNFTVNNVSPSAKILFLVEVGLGTGRKKNISFLNAYKITGNGMFLEYEVPSHAEDEASSFFLWGSPTNAGLANLTFNFECNTEYSNLKITTLVF